MPPRLDPATLPWARPVILEGSLVRLEPLALAHLDGLAEVGLESSIWRYMPIQPRTTDDLRAWLETGLRNAATGHGGSVGDRAMTRHIASITSRATKARSYRRSPR